MWCWDRARTRRNWLGSLGQVPAAAHSAWPQLGHAGALSYRAISTPAGPSALRLDALTCDALSAAELEELPARYAAAARLARDVGFSGVEVQAGHGFLLSQLLSPLFIRRTDRFGGSIEARSRVLLEIVRRVRRDAGNDLAIAVKINATDHLDGRLTEQEALVVVEALGDEAVDLIEISGGTCFPGARSSSDRPSSRPYSLDFARRARGVTDAPLMLTGGVRTRGEAVAALRSGSVDVVDLARALVLDPDLPRTWLRAEDADPRFPAFRSPPSGGVTAWYTMRLTALANHRESGYADSTAEAAIAAYESRDNIRAARWRDRFGP